MAYKYEDRLYANSLVRSTTENVFIETGETKEIKEIYRKAKAFDEIVEIYSDNDHYSDEYVMETIQEQIDLMERADDER